jgi:superfamily II DNA/RNA helicase
MSEDMKKGVNSRYLLDCAKHSKKVLLLTATPFYNYGKDIVNLISMVNGTDPIPDYTFDEISNDIPMLEDYFNCKISLYSPPPEELEGKYPSSTIENVFIEMSPSYLKKYEEVEENILKEENYNLFGNTKDLKKYYNGVRRASNILENESPKIEWVMKYIKKNKNSKILIFSHYLKCGINFIMNKLKEKDYQFQHIDGDMSIAKRKQAVDDYNQDKVKILLISKAGGEGLDLKNTHSVIVLEPSWNESTISQVIGRAVRYESHIHLPKEKQNVQVYRLHTIKPNEKKEYQEIIEKRKINKKAEGILSVDLFLLTLSLYKQDQINKLLEKIKKSSIEVRKCKDVDYTQDFKKWADDRHEQLFRQKEKEKEEKKQKEKEEKEEKKQKEKDKKKEKKEKEEKEKNKKGQDYSDSSGDTVFTKKNRCLIFLKNNGIVDKKTYKKWMLENHPDKLQNLDISEEEKEKRSVLVKRVTDCVSFFKDTSYDF